MSPVAIRDAQPTDAGSIGAILSAFAMDTPWMPRLHTGAEDIGFAGLLIDRGWVRVAESDGQVAGFIARDGADIQALYVTQGARGQGTGAALLQEAQSRAAQLSLWTFQANTDAQRFYARHGFTEAERSDGARNDEGLPDIRLVWARKET